MISILLFLQVAASTPEPDDATLTETLITTTQNMPGLPSDSAVRTKMRVTYQGKRARQDRIEGLSPHIPSASPDAYVIIDGVEGIFYVVDTIKKEFSRLDFVEMLEDAAGLMSTMDGLELKMKDVTASSDSIGPGEPVLGYATNHWQMIQKMVITAGIAGESQATQMIMRQDVYYAPALDSLLGPSLYWVDSLEVSNPFESMFDSASVAKFKAAHAKLPKGVPLKTTAAQTMMMGLEEMTTTITTEVTRVEKVRRPASYFAIPEGYKEVEPDFLQLDKPAQ
jgi:hypothetical protein